MCLCVCVCVCVCVRVCVCERERESVCVSVRRVAGLPEYVSFDENVSHIKNHIIKYVFLDFFFQKTSTHAHTFE